MIGSESGGSTSIHEAPALGRFHAALETLFRVDVHGVGSAEFRLIEVATAPEHGGWESFSLLFAGPDPPVLWDGTYTVHHDEIGSFPLFLVAVRTDGEAQHYEAVFNRRSR